MKYSYQTYFNILLFIIAIIALIVGSVALSRDDRDRFVDMRSSASSGKQDSKTCHVLSDDCDKDFDSECDGNVVICYEVEENSTNNSRLSAVANTQQTRMSVKKILARGLNEHDGEL